MAINPHPALLLRGPKEVPQASCSGHSGEDPVTQANASDAEHPADAPLNNGHEFPHLLPPTALGKRYPQTHFTDEETESQSFRTAPPLGPSS